MRQCNILPNCGTLVRIPSLRAQTFVAWCCETLLSTPPQQSQGATTPHEEDISPWTNLYRVNTVLDGLFLYGARRTVANNIANKNSNFHLVQTQNMWDIVVMEYRA